VTNSFTYIKQDLSDIIPSYCLLVAIRSLDCQSAFNGLLYLEQDGEYRGH
jgi:hypothetical protein